MKWYDMFSWFYDKALEDRYEPFRKKALTSETLGTGSFVLDVACGTGQNFKFIRRALGEDVHILGLDFSQGMLKKARDRVQKEGWSSISCVYQDAQTIDLELIQSTLNVQQVDCVVCALGLTAVPDWIEAFYRSWNTLKPGGRYVIFDVYSEKRTWAARNVEWVARANLLRKVWEPLEAESDDFTMRFLDNSTQEFGGRLFVAYGSKQAKLSSVRSEDKH